MFSVRATFSVKTKKSQWKKLRRRKRRIVCPEPLTDYLLCEILIITHARERYLFLKFAKVNVYYLIFDLAKSENPLPIEGIKNGFQNINYI